MPDCVVQEYTSVIMLRFLNSFFTKNSSSFKKSKSPALNLLPKKIELWKFAFLIMTLKMMQENLTHLDHLEVYQKSKFPYSRPLPNVTCTQLPST